MDKNIVSFEKNYGISFVDDFLMFSNDKIYFYVDLNNGTLCSNEIKVLAGNWATINDDWYNETITIDYILSFFDKSCEHVEVKGYDVFFNEVVGEINQNTPYHSVDIPIVYNDIRKWLGLTIRRFDDKKIALCSIRDVTEEKNNLEKLYLTSYKDQLTGLFNRNTCIFHIENIKKDANIYIYMIDLDCFKTVNDTYGHNAGDEVLKDFGNKLMDLVDSNRIFYRLSGDEFLIQVKNYTHEEAEAFAKEIIEKARCVKYKDISLTASIGIAKYNPQMKRLDILRHADRALYIAKEKRDTYCFDEGSL